MIFATSGTDVSCAGPPKHDLIGPSLSLMGLGRVRLGIRGPAANTAQPPPELRCLLFTYLFKLTTKTPLSVMSVTDITKSEQPRLCPSQ